MGIPINQLFGTGLIYALNMEVLQGCSTHFPPTPVAMIHFWSGWSNPALSRKKNAKKMQNVDFTGKKAWVVTHPHGRREAETSCSKRPRPLQLTELLAMVPVASLRPAMCWPKTVIGSVVYNPYIIYNPYNLI